MPVPKKRHSNTRTNQRRANWKVKAANLGVCPSCGEAVLPHHACPSCGSYQGRQAVAIKAEKGKTEEK